MSSELGSDPEELDNLARLCDQTASAFDEARGEVNNKLGGVFWKGPDADRFRESWNSSTQQLLRRATDSLKRAGDDLRVQAREQRQVSRS